MKSILYVGAALMVGASIYGFVDYKNTSHKEEFAGMYDEEKVSTPVVVPEKKTEIIVSKKKSAPVTKNKSSKKLIVDKQATVTEEPISSIQPLDANEQLSKTKSVIIEKAEVDKKIADNAPTTKKLKKKKRINSKMFSRGAIREEVYVEEPEVKKSSTKN